MKKSVLFLFAALIFASCETLLPPETTPIVKTSDDVFVEYTSAKLSGKISSFEDVKEVGFNFSNSEGNLNQYCSGSFDPEGNITATLNGLTSGKKYFYQMVAKTKRGQEFTDNRVYSFITFTQGPVDLGLPSGLKWAACNLDAELPTEAGGYYAWGETKTKNYYDWTTYKYYGSQKEMTKYTGPNCRWAKTIDGKVILDPEDDAAHVKLGGNWRMPTSADYIELATHCASSSVEINGVKGVKFISKKTMDEGNFIFIPAYGYMENGKNYEYTIPWFWTSSLEDQNEGQAAYSVRPTISSPTRGFRYIGHQIRPVTE